MNIKGFTDRGEWYKGNLHCHSTNSDGHLSPEQVAAYYKEHGYSFLAISDHDRFSDYRKELDSDGFIILPALEASAVLFKEEGSRDRICVHHMQALLGTEDMQKQAEKGLLKHLDPYPRRIYYGSWDGGKVAQEMQDDLKAHGFVTTYNHPVWSRVREDEFVDLNGITALEIYNYGTVIESGTGFDTIHWDVMLSRGKHISAFASDDNHNSEKLPDSFGGYIMVMAEKLDHEHIIRSILDGNYYSSSGPEICDWGIRDDVAYVKCSRVDHVNFICGNYINAGATVLGHDGGITEAEFPLRGNEAYIRVECVDMFGKTAWTNPIYLR